MNANLAHILAVCALVLSVMAVVVAPGPATVAVLLLSVVVVAR